MSARHHTDAAAGWCGRENGAHTCRLPIDHPGDHECAGCHDVWNRGPWDDDEDAPHGNWPADDMCVVAMLGEDADDVEWRRFA